MVSSQITSAVQEIILNGAALLASSQPLNPSPSPAAATAAAVDPATRAAATHRFAEASSADLPSLQLWDRPDLPTSDLAADDIVEIDATELLAEHVHFCEICGKGFRRDANLRMHMRAHGDRFKTLEALSKPDREVLPLDGGEAATGRRMRFSCPYPGCNRNRAHKKFRPLKSAACVKNHFKRSHCPKMYSCYRCNKKSFSVVADLKSHLKHCGETRWRCSCGTSFSRKDKLFGHISLFEGHMPVVEDLRKGGSEEERWPSEEEESGGGGGGRAEGEEPGGGVEVGVVEEKVAVRGGGEWRRWLGRGEGGGGSGGGVEEGIRRRRESGRLVSVSDLGDWAR